VLKLTKQLSERRLGETAMSDNLISALEGE
jgi:hypothetical protein